MDKIKFYGWNCFKLTSGDIDVVVAPEIGGRIISLTYQGEELMFVQKERGGETFDFSTVEGLRAEKRRIGFRFWGGDKTWVAPQKDWWGSIPPLELDAGQYKTQVEGDKIMMTSPVCRETGLQIIRHVSFDKDGAVQLHQEMINKSKQTLRKGIWNVTQLLRPADVYIPTTKSKLRSYHEEDLTLPSHDIVVTERDGWCKVPCRDNTLFKFGGLVENGTLLSLKESKGGTLAFLKMFEPETDAEYAHSSCLEIFNARDYDYFEVEIHAPYQYLKPGERYEHAQEWRIKHFNGTPSPDDIYKHFTGRRLQKAAR